MFDHTAIWAAIDRLAKSNNLSTSGLARKAGLDPTAFNRSKRVTPDGKPRWPSTESIAKILAVTESTLTDMMDASGRAGLAGKKSGSSTALGYEIYTLSFLLNRGLPLNLQKGGDFFVLMDTTSPLPAIKRDTHALMRVADLSASTGPFLIGLEDKQMIGAAEIKRTGDMLHVTPAAPNAQERKIELSDVRFLLSHLSSPPA
ncbi:MAG: hypothetical protein AB7E85_02045 [Pseudobdellovibrionaceae bacterium]